jgi:hypothetical protein
MSFLYKYIKERVDYFYIFGKMKGKANAAKKGKPKHFK